ncbi:MAG: class I SAM-dependent DNA methyltransferase [Bacteroidales bacterium]|nr:class I SAM-dependent DNA methyltransferase [Bacteroidales bacterium]
MASDTKQRQAAKAFVKDWLGKGYEKGETARFWMDLLGRVFGITNPAQFIQFELPVKTILKEKGSDFIDGYIPSTKVLIEQKGSKVNLSEKYRQSDGSELTPYQQARRYAAGLPQSQYPRWIVACNFTTFEVHDMERPNDAPEVVQLADLEKEYTRLNLLVDDTNVHLKKELDVSIQAGEIVGVLYDKILAQYKDPSNPDSQKALNKLCVRLVFCLYAEDAGIFGTKDMFHDYMSQFEASMFREQLIKLFRILDQKPEERDPYEDEKLLAFPYVNGGMFAGEIEIPRITEEIRSLILQRASDDFDWSLISPTIFGAVFESTLNPETRRAGGMHYTSIENIHKVIDPLFLDELKEELAEIKVEKVAKTKKDKAYAFQDKLAGLKFFDPACGSGNFLTESYTSLRRLENEALRIIFDGNRVIGEFADPIKVSINQFYGIEINDFACSVAQTALWIAESQMMKETEDIAGFNLDPLPLKTYTNIHEGNALRMDWSEVVPAAELNYIMGNPPFLGARIMSAEQKDDLISVFGPKWKNIGNMDYVTGWYKKSLEMMQINPNIHAALVSTNSITQGEQVANLWRPLMGAGVNIDFAWRTFIWDSEASQKAHVHCVIVGFSIGDSARKRRIFDGNNVTYASNINGYLVDAPSVAIESRSKPIAAVPEMVFGSMPNDGGFLSDYSDEDHSKLVKQYPESSKLFRRLMGATEFINNEKRWCLWLKDVSPLSYIKIPFVMEAIEKVRRIRLESNRESTRRLAETPMLFGEIRQPESSYLLVPSTSSERRDYIPIGFIEPDVISNNANLLIPEATLYTFGVVTSSVHMAWMRAVAGRLEMRYRYSAKIVYNNFPWPDATEEQRAKIEKTAQAILDARQVYPNASMADLYGNLVLFPDLLKAHRANDAAVLEAYGFPRDATESDIVARLFKMYQELTKNS